LERRQDARALDHLNKAIEIDPNEIDANYELGKLARRNGDLQKAIEHYQQAAIVTLDGGKLDKYKESIDRCRKKLEILNPSSSF